MQNSESEKGKYQRNTINMNESQLKLYIDYQQRNTKLYIDYQQRNTKMQILTTVNPS